MINCILNRVILIGIALVLSAGLYAQEPDIRIVNGQKFVAHEVSAGETLWAISQRYDQDVEQIVAQNPGSRDKLSIGQILLIPYDKKTKKELKNDPPRIENGDVIHTVKKGETLFSLSKRYDIEINDIFEANPALNDGLKLGMVVKIPKEKVNFQEDQISTAALNDGSLTHQVVKGETIYGISKKYGIAESDLLNANGGLPKGLLPGAFIRIPTMPEDALEDPSNSAVPAGALKDQYQVAYLLPFNHALTDSLLEKQKFQKDTEFPTETEAALHFYFGSMMALDSVKMRGLSAEVHIKEVNDDSESTSKALNGLGDKQVDLFIGPFHKNSFEQVLEKARTAGAHVVCPTDQSNKVILGYAGSSKARATGNVQVAHLAKSIVKNHFADNIIMLEAPVWKEMDLRDQMRNSINRELAAYVMSRTDSVSSCTMDKGFISILEPMLDPAGMNVLVVPTNEVYYSSELMTRLSKLDDEISIMVYGMESWMQHENIDATYKDRYRLHVPAADFIDIDNKATIDFISAFRNEHGTDPNEYAFLGYDISLFYLSALNTYGTGFSQKFDHVSAPVLHMDFDMTQAGPESGFLNEHTFILSYEGLRLTRVD